MLNEPRRSLRRSSVVGVWQRIVDWVRGNKTRRLLADRDCAHDGSHPQCTDCERNYTVW